MRAPLVALLTAHGSAGPGADRPSAAPPAADAWAKRVAACFDRRADAYAREYAARTWRGEALRLRRDRVLAVLDRVVPRGGAVLDVGCGPGALAPSLHARGHRFCGVDLSPGVLAVARRRHGALARTAFVRADMGRLPFADGRFDAVVAMGALEYTADPVASLAELARVARPGGHLVVTLPYHWSPYNRWHRFGERCYRRLTGRAWAGPLAARADERRQHAYSEAWLPRHAPPGCAVVETEYCWFKLLPAPLDRWLPWLDSRLMRLLQPLGRGPMRKLGSAIVVAVRTPSPRPATAPEDRAA